MALISAVQAAVDIAPGAAQGLTSGQVLSALVLAGLFGMVGQTVRAIVGLKKMNDDAAATGVSASDLFIASRLVTSEIIGFVVGIITALSLDINKLVTITDFQLFLGIAAAGYAGTDVVEAFARRLGATGTGAGTSTSTSGGAKGGADSSGQGAAPPPKPRSSLQQNQIEAYQAAKDDGLSDAAAQALVANMTGESLAKPNDYHYDVSHYSQGIVQWDPTRSEAIKNQFGKYPRDMSVAEQTQAAIWEIRTNNRFAASKNALEKETNPSDIVAVLVRNYEVPEYPDEDIVTRVAYLPKVASLIKRSLVA